MTRLQYVLLWCVSALVPWLLIIYNLVLGIVFRSTETLTANVCLMVTMLATVQLLVAVKMQDRRIVELEKRLSAASSPVA